MRYALAFLVALALTACGGSGPAGPGDQPGPEPIPAGVPVVSGGFTGWMDYQPTPSGEFGIVNGTGQFVTQVDAQSATQTFTFLVSIAPGVVWESDGSVPPDFYLVTVRGANGFKYRRYHRYDPSIGREAAVVSNANLDLGL